jgi:hypothetical protein
MLRQHFLGLGGSVLAVVFAGACASSGDLDGEANADTGAGNTGNTGAGNTGNTGSGNTGNTGSGNTGNTASGGSSGNAGNAGTGGAGSGGVAGGGTGGTSGTSGTAGTSGAGGTGGQEAIEMCDGLTVVWTDPGDGTLTYTYNGDTNFNTDDHDSCVAAVGPGFADVVFAIPFDFDARLDIEVLPMWWTAAVQLSDTCLEAGVCESPLILPFPFPTEPILLSTTGTTGDVKYLGIDAGDPLTPTGVYTLSLTLTAAEENCSGLPVTLAAPDLAFTHDGDTTLRGHDVSAECADAKGATTQDAVYEITVPGRGTVEMSVAPDGWDAALEIRDGATCETLSALACIDAPATTGAESYHFRKETNFGEVYWAVVEGTFETATAKAGPYTFNATFTPEPDKEKCEGQEVTWTAGPGTVSYSDSGDLNEHYDDLGRCRTQDDSTDVVYRLETPDEPGTLEITVTGKDNTWQPSVGVHASCDAWELGDCIQPQDYVMNDVRRQAGTQTLFVTIEGDNPDNPGTPAAQEYTFDVRFIPEPPEETCSGLAVTWTDIDTAEHPTAKTFAVDGDTSANWDDYDGGCAKAGAKDAVYEVIVPESGTLTLSAQGDGIDLVLYAAGVTCDNTTLVCAKSGGIEGFAEDIAIVNALKDTVYYVFVDGGDAVASGDNSGAFTLTGFLDP